MMRALSVRALCTVAWVLVFGGCWLHGTHAGGLPPGEYVNSTGEERITVGDDWIVFNIRIEEGYPLVERRYELHVDEEGVIMPVPTTSVDAAFGVGRFKWTWNGEAIFQDDVRSDKTDRFVLRTDTPEASRNPDSNETNATNELHDPRAASAP